MRRSRPLQPGRLLREGRCQRPLSCALRGKEAQASVASAGQGDVQAPGEISGAPLQRSIARDDGASRQPVAQVQGLMQSKIRCEREQKWRRKLGYEIAAGGEGA
jgi:hypothetical protein